MVWIFAPSTPLSSCLSPSVRRGGSHHFPFHQLLPLTGNTSSPRVCGCDLRPLFQMGNEALLMWPCPGHLSGAFWHSGEGLRGFPWVNAHEWTQVSCLGKASLGNTLQGWLRWLFDHFFTCQLLACQTVRAMPKSHYWGRRKIRRTMLH